MPIRRKSSIQKKFFESMGQGSLFGHDNIHFKTVNLPQKQKFINLCKKFNVKLVAVSYTHLTLPTTERV